MFWTVAYTVIGFLLGSINTVVLKSLLDKESRLISRDVPYGLIFIVFWVFWPAILAYQIIAMGAYLFGIYIDWLTKRYGGK